MFIRNAITVLFGVNDFDLDLDLERLCMLIATAYAFGIVHNATLNMLSREENNARTEVLT